VGMEKKVKHDTSLFKISEIAEKDDAIASIENKSTCTKVTDIEIKDPSDETLDESLHLKVCEEFLLIT
jgi:hypothetical protein